MMHDCSPKITITIEHDLPSTRSNLALPPQIASCTLLWSFGLDPVLRHPALRMDNWIGLGCCRDLGHLKIERVRSTAMIANYGSECRPAWIGSYPV